MQRVTRSSAVEDKPSPPDVEGAPGYFHGGDPVTGTPATTPGYEWFNRVQEELVNVVTQLGVDPLDGASDDQVAKAIMHAISSFQRLSAQGVLAPHKNLRVVNNPTNPLCQLDVTADGVVLTDSSNGQILITNLSELADITLSGAGGLDTGSEAASTWYHLWAVSDGVTADVLLSLSSTAPAMPAGYTYKGYVGAVYNETGGDLRRCFQDNTRAGVPLEAVVSGGYSGGVATAVDLSAAVPPTAKAVHFYGESIDTGSGTALMIFPGYVDGQPVFWARIGSAATSDNNVTGQLMVPLLTPQKVFYQTGTGSESAEIFVIGWEY